MHVTRYYNSMKLKLNTVGLGEQYRTQRELPHYRIP
jgi:hypothetical protein